MTRISTTNDWVLPASNTRATKRQPTCVVKAASTSRTASATESDAKNVEGFKMALFNKVRGVVAEEALPAALEILSETRALCAARCSDRAHMNWAQTTRPTA